MCGYYYVGYHVMTVQPRQHPCRTDSINKVATAAQEGVAAAVEGVANVVSGDNTQPAQPQPAKR